MAAAVVSVFVGSAASVVSGAEDELHTFDAILPTVLHYIQVHTEYDQIKQFRDKIHLTEKSTGHVFQLNCNSTLLLYCSYCNDFSLCFC